MIQVMYDDDSAVSLEKYFPKGYQNTCSVCFKYFYSKETIIRLRKKNKRFHPTCFIDSCRNRIKEYERRIELINRRLQEAKGKIESQAPTIVLEAI